MYCNDSEERSGDAGKPSRAGASVHASPANDDTPEWAQVVAWVVWAFALWGFAAMVGCTIIAAHAENPCMTDAEEDALSDADEACMADAVNVSTATGMELDCSKHTESMNAFKSQMPGTDEAGLICSLPPPLPDAGFVRIFQIRWLHRGVPSHEFMSLAAKAGSMITFKSEPKVLKLIELCFRRASAAKDNYFFADVQEEVRVGCNINGAINGYGSVTVSMVP